MPALTWREVNLTSDQIEASSVSEGTAHGRRTMWREQPWHQPSRNGGGPRRNAHSLRPGERERPRRSSSDRAPCACDPTPGTAGKRLAHGHGPADTLMANRLLLPPGALRHAGPWHDLETEARNALARAVDAYNFLEDTGLRQLAHNHAHHVAALVGGLFGCDIEYSDDTCWDVSPSHSCITGGACLLGSPLLGAAPCADRTSMRASTCLTPDTPSLCGALVRERATPAATRAALTPTGRPLWLIRGRSSPGHNCTK